jgi:hypothetical protein
MKKVLVPGLLALMAVGMAQRQANAGGFSIGISIGDDHRHRPAQVISAPPVIVAQPAPVYAPAQIVYAQPTVAVPQVCSEPQVVIVQPQPRYVTIGGWVPYGRYDHYGRDWHGHYESRYEHHRR